MKNRLEVAREFLRDDGVMFIQCDDNEQAYLKVLCDEIFGRENFVGCLVWRKKAGGGQDSINFIREHEYILCYNKAKWNIIEKTISQDIKDFNKIINGKNAKILKLEKWGIGSLREDAPSLYYSITNPNGQEIFPVAPNGKDGRWRKKPENLDNNHIFWQEDSKGRLTPYEVIYYDEVKDSDKILKTRTIWIDEGNTTLATKEMQVLFADNNQDSHNKTQSTSLFATPKPEALLKRIIEISTQPGDLVMDFFAGSGTTLAVAHKMGRRWVGIEQMDYIENITKERLCKVILGEQGGVSKAVGWNPLEKTLLEDSLPNAFVYAELLPLNETYKELILKADENDMAQIIEKMQKNAFLDYRVDFARAVADEDFISLSLGDKKKILLQCLDENLSYVPFSDIKDRDFGISDEIIKANEAFYKGGHQ